MPHDLEAPWRDIAAGIDGIVGAQPVMTIEPALAQYISHYRTAAGALPLTAFRDLLDDKRQFIACRPFKCAELQDERLAGRRVLLQRWQWGSPVRDVDTCQLRLYEITFVDGNRTGP